MASKSTASSVSVRTCESVAQKLFIQCRDSGTSLKPLTGSVRTLRNVLGEVDEALDDHVGQQDDPNLPCSISRCEAILLKLEAALVLSRCSSRCEVNTNTVASFTTELDTATSNLVAAFQKMTRTDVVALTVRPDTLSPLRRESQSSRISTTGCIANKDTPSDTCSCGLATTSIDGTKRQSRSATEKEVFYPEKQVYHHYHPDRANRLQRSSSLASLQSKGSSSNARPDPYLASPFEAACGLIHNDDTLVDHTAKNEPSWIPSAQLEGDEQKFASRQRHSSGLGAADMTTSHSRKDSLLGDVETMPSQYATWTGEHAQKSRPKTSDNDGPSTLPPAEGLLKKLVGRTSVDSTAIGAEDKPAGLTNGERTDASSQDTGQALSNEPGRANATYLRRPPPPTPANTQAEVKDLAGPTSCGELPEDAAQSTALPESDLQDDLYSSEPVLNPMAKGKDGEMSAPPPLIVTKTISEVKTAGPLATESSPESAGIDAGSIAKGTASQEEKITRNERDDDAPELVQVTKRQVPMKSNSVADIKQTINPPRAEKEAWPSSRGASRYHTAKRAPSAPPAVTFQPAVTRFPISRNEHHNATCDVCDQKVYGRRHKCLDCADWDHCDKCVDKARPLRPEGHRFITLGQPVGPRPKDVLDATADEYLAPLSDNPPDSKLVKKDRKTKPSANGTTTPVSRKTAPERLPPVVYAESPEFVGDVHHRTFYGPGGIDEATPTELLDEERVKLIVHFFNTCDWERAEKFLIGHLDSLAARSVESSAARRVQHLLAVCASFRGEWDEAMTRFIKVLKAPIKRVADIDDGDCAATHWLGDLYAMQNRRAEALLAYSIAGRSSLFNRSDPSLRLAIQAEQSTVQIGISKADFKPHWSLEGESCDPTSILNKNIMSMAVAKQILASPPVAFDDAATPYGESDHRRSSSTLSPLRQDRPRASYMSNLDHGAPASNIWDSDLMKITPWSFVPNSPWPMPFDPLICLANIARGRLYAYECDMLSVFAKNPDAKLPRPSLLSLTKLSHCFTHPSLPWLITTLRTHLTSTSISHSEIANIHGTFFCCRYPAPHPFPHHRKPVATVNYFAIALFRHALPGKGFGVEVIGDDGLRSARIARVGDAEGVVNGAETKRVRGLVRAGLEEAAMRRERVERRWWGCGEG